MKLIGQLSLISQATFYALAALMALFAVVVLGWQIMVLGGRSMKNPDGSRDDWHVQPVFYGMAFADVVLACPAVLAGIVLAAVGSRWGFYTLALTASWFLWANTMTTVNSLRFESPRITLSWIFTFPAGIVVGAGFIIWTIVHFDTIYAA